MEIKKTLKETKEKVKNWYEENKDAIVVSAITGIGVCISYAVGIYVGRERVIDELLLEFGIQSRGDDTTVCLRNRDTGFLDGILSKDFEKRILSQPSVIRYDDGSWEFENERNED